MDLIGPMQTESLRVKKYIIVVVHDFSHFTWIRFLRGKSDTVKVCINLCLSLQREQGKNIVQIMSDHGKEFEDEELDSFYEAKGIHHEYSTPLTPQQNGFWAEAMDTACHIHNRITTPSVDTSVNSYDDSSKSTQKEVMASVSEIAPSSNVQKNHPSSSIIGDPLAGITTKKRTRLIMPR
ncbi:Peptidase aspartic, catalytic [Cucumis melo var. makuwa]|uniref:Peptidase aspartic, catalytic n=1 Tax=Cucumis melo var. makuwa TaxID=1194695 RepID=A0A5A7TTX9_CUCMM|nr:Peptidase aspartic, catalytic [Cucumis melo var. makuwa]